MADTESELKESTELKKLFALWQEKQKEDIDRNLKNVELDKRQLKKLKCTLRDMGISSHFVELLDQEQDCLLTNSAEMKDRWKNVLKNAFNISLFWNKTPLILYAKITDLSRSQIHKV